MAEARAGRSRWWLLLVPPGFCVVCMLVGALVPKPPEFGIKPGLEPAGTCAVEGELSGLPAGAATPYPVTVMLSSERGARAFATTATAEGKFRVAVAPCDEGDRSFAIAVMTADRRGGRLHSTLGGNSPLLWVKSGDRLEHVPIDLDTGWSWTGRVVDDGGTPLEGVQVSPAYPIPNRDGWAPPGVFTITDGSGTYRLHGVNGAKFSSGPPALNFYRRGFLGREQEVPAPAKDEVVQAPEVTLDAE